MQLYENLIWLAAIFRRRRSGGGGVAPTWPSVTRIAEDATTRLAEDGTTRVTEGY